MAVAALAAEVETGRRDMGEMEVEGLRVGGVVERTEEEGVRKWEVAAGAVEKRMREKAAAASSRAGDAQTLAQAARAR